MMIFIIMLYPKIELQSFSRSAEPVIVPERLRGTEFTETILNGSPRCRFEHSGVLPGAKLHARHDGHSEIMS